jgi:hypothetical protein
VEKECEIYKCRALLETVESSLRMLALKMVFMAVMSAVLRTACFTQAEVSRKKRNVQLAEMWRST